MGFVQPIVTSDVQRGRSLARGRFRRVDLSRSIKTSRHFDAEIDVHRQIARGRVVVEEDIVSVGAKARLGPQEFPDLVQGCTPGRPDLSDRNLAANRSQFAGLDLLNRYGCAHDVSTLAAWPA